ncbi:MAG: heme lyase CcmF/NrfE family subunit [Candidatus Eisenbacteria bacterium]
MNDFGNIALIVVYPVTLFGTVVSFLGGWRRREGFVRAGERSLILSFVLVTAAILALVGLFVTNDFGNTYVAGHSNEELPLAYKVTALWAGQEGSLLFWHWLLTAYGMAVIFANRNRNRDLMPYVTSILLVSGFFFANLNLFVANPFGQLVQEHAGGIVPFAAADGRGLNPLLQHPVMVIHPPLLYLGYVGFVVPFAFAVAALWTKSPGVRWLLVARRWSLFAWLFLTAGVILGARWAYVELGWGGYWAWDPVENASLMPWLTGTAFLHSVIIQEKRGMLKVWNISLIIATYMLCVFGTFLTRSGIVSSVHAFAQSPVGFYFITFIGFGLLVSVGLVLSRKEYLKSEQTLDSMLSRESSFLFNNLLFLVACFAVLWGTMFPVISEAVRGEKISVGPPFFNRINIPVGLFMLFLSGLAPLLAWRRTSWSSLRRSFALPVTGMVVTGAVLFLMAVRSMYSLICFSLAVFVVVTIVSEFYRGARVRRRQLGEPILKALGNLMLRNPRRYGGYIVHFGVVLVFIGIAGSAYNRNVVQELQVGGEMELGKYKVRVENLEEGVTPNYEYARAALALFDGDRPIGRYTPERRYYNASEQPSSEVEIHSTFVEDLYLVYAASGAHGGAVIQVYRNPLVRWVWIGGIVMVAGTLVCLVPSRRPRNS